MLGLGLGLEGCGLGLGLETGLRPWPWSWPCSSGLGLVKLSQGQGHDQIAYFISVFPIICESSFSDINRWLLQCSTEFGSTFRNLVANTVKAFSAFVRALITVVKCKKMHRS